MPSASARPRAVARPMRTPVKLPGPVPTTSASIAPGCRPARRTSSSAAASTSRASVSRSPTTSPSHRSAHDVREVAVSKAKIVLTLDPDPAVRLVDVLERHRGSHRRQPGARVLGPLDEGNRAIEVRLEVAPVLGAEAPDAVEVEVRDGGVPGVAVADRVGRARDGLADAERAARSTDERRLAGAELAGDRDDVARRERGREPCCERLRLGGG